MDDIKLAMLGSKEAAKRLTEAGVLLPCPVCSKQPDIKCKPMFRKAHRKVESGKSTWERAKYYASLTWNTRAAVEMEGIE